MKPQSSTPGTVALTTAQAKALDMCAEAAAKGVAITVGRTWNYGMTAPTARKLVALGYGTMPNPHQFVLNAPLDAEEREELNRLRARYAR